MTTTEPNAEHSGAGAPQIADRHLRSELWLPTLLSVIAGMVDVIGFLSFGPFTAHVTGNLLIQFVLISCLCSWRKSRSRQLTFGFIIPPCT